MKRRTNVEIAEIADIHIRTDVIARAIDARVNGESLDGPSIRAASYWNFRADYQREVADDIKITFTTKDAAVAERVALAIKTALEVA